MKPLNTSELALVSGGLYINVPNTGIPQPIFDEIEFAVQNIINNKSEYNYWMVYLCANGCMPYVETYLDNFIEAIFDDALS